jgi:hypothetical protein
MPLELPHSSAAGSHPCQPCGLWVMTDMEAGRPLKHITTIESFWVEFESVHQKLIDPACRYFVVLGDPVASIPDPNGLFRLDFSVWVMGSYVFALSLSPNVFF